MAARGWFFAVALLLAACGSQPKREEVLVSQLAQQLAGSYDNLAQSRASTAHAALRLMIAPVQAPLVGDHVFYVQETAADDPRRVLAQRLYVLDPVPGREQAVLAQLDFREPSRWRDGHLNRDLFRSLLIEDVRLRSGCELLFSRSGERFEAAVGSACRTTSRSTGETLRVEQRLELDRDGLNVFERHRDAAGVVVYGDGEEAWYRYVRRADEPW